jgi:phytoene dehydrogenase-like protein
MQYDVIIIGAGHNGLTAAAYLARAGKRVLVLERRELPGGTLVTEDFGGFQADMVRGGTLNAGIARELGIKPPGPSAGAELISLLPDGKRLVLGSDPRAAAESIRPYSAHDAGRWPEFVRFMEQAGRFLEKSYRTLIPSLPVPPLGGALDLARLGLDLRLRGRRDMLNIIRALAMSANELLEEYFESQVVRGAVASLGVHAVTLGPLSAGTSFNMIHNWMNRGGPAHRYIGQASSVTQALADAVRSHGGEIRTGAEVAAINVHLYRCTGVTLASGEEIQGRSVLSAVDPRRTFLSLVGAASLPPEFVWKVQSIKMRGSVARIHLGMAALPPGMQPGKTYVVAPSVQYLEQAYDAAKYGEISQEPYLEVTTTAKTVSIHFQFAPYLLKGSTWQQQRPALEELAVRTLEAHFPGLEAGILARKVLTPLDLEEVYGLTEGDLNHGQLMLDQFFFMRPVPGYAGHKTPIDGLFLGGSGVHAGGGISGFSGRNAARVVSAALDHINGKGDE